jgi:energy-coupling factor transporter ATP-binding protein EcfA2
MATAVGMSNSVHEKNKKTKRKQETVIICGRSGSGKSSLTKKLTKGIGAPVHIINDRTNSTGFKSTGWEDACKLKNACLIFEDVIGATKTEFKILQNCLAFSNNHLNLTPIYILVHSLLNNGVHGLLSYVTHVIITAVKANVSSLNVALQYFRFDKAERAEFLSRFLRVAEPFGHFVLDIEKRSLVYVGPNSTAGKQTPTLEGSMTDSSSSSQSANRFLSLLPESGKALAIYDLIRPKLKEANLDAEDLTITLKSARLGKRVRISLIDYIFALTTPDAEVSKEISLLHRYISAKVVLPICFVGNVSLRR